MPELVAALDADADASSRTYRAKSRCAAGVLEGLRHFGLLQ